MRKGFQTSISAFKVLIPTLLMCLIIGMSYISKIEQSTDSMIERYKDYFVYQITFKTFSSYNVIYINCAKADNQNRKIDDSYKRKLDSILSDKIFEKHLINEIKKDAKATIAVKMEYFHYSISYVTDEEQLALNEVQRLKDVSSKTSIVIDRYIKLPKCQL